MKKSTKILLGTSIAVTGAATLAELYHYSTKYLMKLALDREGPKSAAKDKDKMMSSGEMSEIMATIMDAARCLKLPNTNRSRLLLRTVLGLLVTGSAPKMQRESLLLCTDGVQVGHRISVQ